LHQEFIIDALQQQQQKSTCSVLIELLQGGFFPPIFLSSPKIFAASVVCIKFAKPLVDKENLCLVWVYVPSWVQT